MNTGTLTTNVGFELPYWDLGVPGLVLCRSTDNVGIPIFAVTHAPTTAALAHWYDPETAGQALAELGPLADWTQDGERLIADPDLGDAAYKIIRKLGGHTASAHGNWKSEPCV